MSRTRDGWGPLCIILLLDAAVISAAVPVTAVTAVELETNLREVFTILVESAYYRVIH